MLALVPNQPLVTVTLRSMDQIRRLVRPMSVGDRAAFLVFDTDLEWGRWSPDFSLCLVRSLAQFEDGALHKVTRHTEKSGAVAYRCDCPATKPECTHVDIARWLLAVPRFEGMSWVAPDISGGFAGFHIGASIYPDGRLIRTCACLPGPPRSHCRPCTHLQALAHMGYADRPHEGEYVIDVAEFEARWAHVFRHPSEVVA